ncbi:hypothetical protein [Aristaeella hokkaidonensis]|uniref:Uncharacterized protein n=1 Tax=Aristaeella hokkaidonensis TaxID=3046382 RepID=A0AC61N481_9FIRM|nr:hypothetical protein [Aristaeella hokkaidonensis]QUC66361.1 hypothetical protein JYE49_10890 [Aristaeella hokkaidonensis]SNT94226.1 hypothetical protein SAMN06297421_104198 [Aristaeella hokkaidonensis]
MTKRLIAFALMLVLIVSLASCAFALDRDGTVISPVAAGGNERGGSPNPGYRVGTGGAIPGGPGNSCYYSCFN